MPVMADGRFFDRRREFREDLEEGVAVIDGGVLRLVNWIRSGFLAAGRDWRGLPGTRFAATLSLAAAGRHFHFHCMAEVVRMDPAQGVVAARFVRLEPAVRCAVDRHFDPAAVLAGGAYAANSRDAVTEGASADGAAADGSRADGSGAAGLPAPAPVPAPVFASLQALDPAGLAAAADCLAVVKAAFARRFHPDAAAPGSGRGPEDRAARTRLFQEFWADLDAMERSVRVLRDAGRPVS